LITLDTSAIVEWLDTRAPAYEAVRAVLDDEVQPPLVPAAVLGEVGHLAERRYGLRAIDAFLGDLDSGAVQLDCGEGDIGRARELMNRYADLKLGVTDAFVAVCAERNGGRVLTLDRRHFDVLARELALTVLP
jgi:predicted nucleic acid-binding protein